MVYNIAFDGNDTTDPRRSDVKYYGLLQAWNKKQKQHFNIY